MWQRLLLLKRELGGKWAIGVVIFQCVIAWVAAFIVHGIVMFVLKQKGAVKKE